MANEVKQVLGSATTVISHAATLANAAWTYSGLAGCTMTALDNTVAYPWALAVLDVPDTFSAAPTADSVVNLYMTRQNVDGTSDVIPAPDGTAIKQAELVGSFVLKAYDVQQRVAIVISLEGCVGSGCANFIIENKSGVSLSYSSNPITVKVTPLTRAPS